MADIVDWLETEPSCDAAWLDDETTAGSKTVAVPTALQDEGKRLEWVRCWRRLNFSQRIYLTALIDSGFVKDIARKAVQQKTGVMPSLSQVESWERTKKVQAAMKMAAELVAVHIDPQANLIRLDKVIQATLTPRDRYAGGERTGEQEIAAGDALRGIELAAKINRQLRDDSVGSNRTTVIINLADDKVEGPIVSEQ